MSPTPDSPPSSTAVPRSSATAARSRAASSRGARSQPASSRAADLRAADLRPADLIAAVPLSLPARIEAILYLKGKPLSLAELAEIAGVNRDEAELGLLTLMADYAHRDTALEIRQEGRSYGLQLRESLGDLVQNLLPLDLSTATLRTLATIALKKRLLQSELVELRGSGAYDHIKELLAQNFIERKRQSEGRSYWLSLTDKFHRTFALDPRERQLQRADPRRQGPAAAGPAAAGQSPAAAGPSPAREEPSPAAPGPAVAKEEAA